MLHARSRIAVPSLDQRPDPLAAGLIQRGHLLAALLADWDGAQTTLACDAVPSAFVLGHPAFLRPRALPPTTPVVTRYDSDLTCCPDGEWRVQTQRTTISADHPLSAVLDAPGLAPFLPGLCRRLLGETLRLGSIPTLSLLDPGDGAKARIADARWLLRDAYDASVPPIRPADLSLEQRTVLQHAVATAPWQFIVSMTHPAVHTRSVGVVCEVGGWKVL